MGGADWRRRSPAVHTEDDDRSMPRRAALPARRRNTLRCLLGGLALVAGLAASAGQVADSQVAQLSSDLRVVVTGGRDPQLGVRIARGDDWADVARRVSEERHADAIAAWNAGEIETGGWVRVPFGLLAPDFRRLLLRHLFPDDRHDGDDWIHVARSGPLATYDEGLWQVAEWFTGDGGHFVRLMEANSLSSPELRAGQAIRIPGDLLDPAFRRAARSDDGSLVYGSDDQGPYAGYVIRQGEALYSAVVGRFTGRTAAEDVQEVAETVRLRSGIRDEHDIPVGFLIKIPLDLLEPGFLPPAHPRRLEAERASAELARELARNPVEKDRTGLDGMIVILDPGHGGRDLGTMNNGVWEHDYVYDVTCRLRQRLQTETRARVVMTLLDDESGCEPSRTDKLTANRQGTVQTNPTFMARQDGEARIAVNLRWYLANSVYRAALRDGVDPDRVVFLSIHADARHPSLRGVMVYVPGEAYRGGTYGSDSSTYRRFDEVKEKPFVRFSKKDRVRSEAVSRRFADAVVEGFRAEGLPIQPHQPVRNRIIRGRWKGVPAVLRGNEIPHKVLVEMVNLSNPSDAALLASARSRQTLADALYAAVVGYFDGD